MYSPRAQKVVLWQTVFSAAENLIEYSQFFIRVYRGGSFFCTSLGLPLAL
jgi:hypothetical protein